MRRSEMEIEFAPKEKEKENETSARDYAFANLDKNKLEGKSFLGFHELLSVASVEVCSEFVGRQLVVGQHLVTGIDIRIGIS
jgi:hypothetical protein